MQRPGRNDLCPCGSGKKYKRCCLGKEGQREQFARDLESHALPLLRELGQYAARRIAQPPERVAAERFPFWRPPLGRLQGARLLDYLIFDHALEQHGATAAREFAAERAPLLPLPQQALLRSWLDVPTQLFVLDSWSGGFANVRAPEDAGAPQLDVMPLERDEPLVPSGRPIALRPLPAGGAHVYPAWPTTFGARSVHEVIEAIHVRHHGYVRRERIVSFEEFLRLEPTVFDEAAAAGSTAPRIIVPGR